MDFSRIIVMSRKSKGINAERELVHKFWDKNWACVRVAGSGSQKYPSPDLLAGNNLRKIVIESKLTNDKAKYFSDDDIYQLKIFASMFGAEPWLAIKFSKDWFFVSPEDLKETKGLNFSISIENARIRGLSFEQLIS